MHHTSLLISKLTIFTTGRGGRKLPPPPGGQVRDHLHRATALLRVACLRIWGPFVVIHQRHGRVSMAMAPGRVAELYDMFSIPESANMTPENLETVTQTSSAEGDRRQRTQHSLTRGATKRHQKEHLGLFLPARTENRPLSNLQTRRDLCCQSRNPQIILVQNGLFSKTGSFSSFLKQEKESGPAA